MDVGNPPNMEGSRPSKVAQLLGTGVPQIKRIRLIKIYIKAQTPLQRNLTQARKRELKTWVLEKRDCGRMG